MNLEENEKQENEGSRLRSINRSNISGAGKMKGNVRRKVRRPVRRPVRRVVREQEVEEDNIELEEEIERPYKRPQKKRKYKRLVFFAIVISAILISLFSTIFSNATISLVLKSEDINVNSVFDAIREPAKTADISYSVLGPFKVQKEVEIKNIERQRENTRAKGTVIIYNTNESGERLDLVNRTRLQAENGNLYRLVGKQSIPGGKKKDGVFVAGQKEVKVEADKIGDIYNFEEIGARFSIPGLAKYKGFSSSYAVAETKIVGGFEGERFIPDKEEEAEKRQTMRREIELELKEKLRNSINTNSLTERIVFDETIFIEYNNTENKQIGDTLIIGTEGILRAASFRVSDIAKILNKVNQNKTISTSPRDLDYKKLELEIENKEEFDVKESSKFTFKIRGETKLFWEIDELLFLTDIADVKKSELDKVILEKYQQVETVPIIQIFPIWRSKLPTNKNKIKIETKYID